MGYSSAGTGWPAVPSMKMCIRDRDITGSDKSYPFRYEGNGNQLFVFEAPIDLLSFICLYPQDWQTRSYLALGGVSLSLIHIFLTPEQAEVEKKPEPKHSLTEKMKFLQEQDKKQPEQDVYKRQVWNE